MVNVFDWDIRKLRAIHPAALILFSYLFAMGAGTFMLLTPYATVEEDISIIEAMYTATSAVCVTGLTVVDTGTYFSFFGQLTILLLIQLGGLGIITFTSFFTLLFVELGFRRIQNAQTYILCVKLS